MNKLITTAAVLAFASAVFAGTASAQNFQAGDLVLDFRASSGTGAGQDLEVNLGLGSSFNFSTSETVLSSTVLNADLVAVYGTNWSSNATLVFSIVGANGSNGTGANDIYISDPGNSSTVTATSPAATSGNAGQITPLYSETSGTAVGTNAYNVTETTLDGSTYRAVLTDYNNTHGTGPYAANYGFVPFITEQTVSTSGSSLDLYLQTPSISHPSVVAATSTDEGTFTLGGNGALTFTAEGGAVVPEPSTYALFGLGALVLVLMRRRTAKA